MITTLRLYYYYKRNCLGTKFRDLGYVSMSIVRIYNVNERLKRDDQTV